jgi:hypothetical protein
LPLRLGPAQVLAQPLDLARLLVDDLLRIARGGIISVPVHALLIAEP